MKIVFEQELYENFEYKNPRDWFHTLESDNVVHGLSFASPSEADAFFAYIQTARQQISNLRGGMSAQLA